MNLNFSKVNTLKGYVRNRSFGPYYLPVSQQNQIMQLYCDQNNKRYSLPQAEPIFSKKYSRLNSLIGELEKFEGLIMSSYYMLPENRSVRKKIYELILKKKTELHFVFEKIVIINKFDIMKLENNIKLSKFASQSHFIFKNLKRND